MSKKRNIKRNLKNNSSDISASLPKEGFVRLSRVLESIPISRSSWFEGVRDGRYPKPIKIGPRAAVYRVEDIRELITKISNGGAA